MSNAVDDASRSLDELVATLKKLQPGQLSEEQFVIVESKAIYAVSALRSVRNMASPVHRLPLEVLGLIFNELMWQLHSREGFIPNYMQVRFRKPQPIQTVSMVSRRWREAALSFPNLWSTIYTCEDGESMLEIIKRSGDTPLRIFVSSMALRPQGVWPLLCHPATLAIPLLNAIASHSHRIQELHLVDISTEFLNETSLAAVTFPQLECLTLAMDAPQPDSEDPPSPPPKLIFCDSSTPHLRRVTLIGCWPFFDTLKRFRGLTHLCVAFTRSLASIGQVMDVLRASPDLVEFCLAHVRLTDDSTPPHASKVILERLRIIAVGGWPNRFRISEFLQYLVFPRDVEIFIWGFRTSVVSRVLRTLVPCFITPKENVRELRLTAPPSVRHSQCPMPSLRSPQSCTIVSNPSAFQLDGDFTSGPTLLAQVPDLLDLSCVRELWLGQRYHEEPSFDEWRLFFTSVPALDTLVVVDRPSHPILSALTLPRGGISAIPLCPNLRTLRIIDRSLSLLRLSLLVEQRDRIGSRLDLCEILALSPPNQPSFSGPAGEALKNQNSTRNEAMAADTAALKDYVGDVIYSGERHFSLFWDVIPSPVFDWQRLICTRPLYDS
ncbi:hypothetical protein PC9H_005761 [Pleurotus ostreatus]|uniref:F-box domain-containing protein n=1 Tax=Pleurotus ostreatus TaxID=5322 RepID=A0A8H6ZZK4_PLEOS|nr:uncharacterized protein PC9H_005761 [Pleurotus ostreatus]KAF7433796.1 hypothetical protein PC9H_005761 [Pleurotus ostreatus]